MREDTKWYLFTFVLWTTILLVGVHFLQRRHQAENEGCQRLCGTHRLLKVSTGLCFCE